MLVFEVNIEPVETVGGFPGFALQEALMTLWEARQRRR